MKIKYNSEKLQKIIDDFTKVTELSICVFSEDLISIANSSYINPAYCLALQNADNAEKCRCCDIELLQKCRISGLAVMHVCHAGLTDMVVPIKKNKITIGYIMIGRIKQNPNFDDIYNSVSYAGEYEYLKELYSNVKYYNTEQSAAITELVLILTSFILLNDIINTETDVFAENAEKFISENLKNELSVSQLCRHFNVSKNYLYGHFHSSYNCTVNEYIVLKRIEYAKKLLINSDMQISDIAEECGISNHTYFCKLFKYKTGLTPLQYRKINTF